MKEISDAQNAYIDVIAYARATCRTHTTRGSNTHERRPLVLADRRLDKADARDEQCARHHKSDVGEPARTHGSLLAAPLRPSWPRRVSGATRAVHRRGPGRRCDHAARQARRRVGVVLRHIAGRHGRALARRAPSGAHPQPRGDVRAARACSPQSGTSIVRLRYARTASSRLHPVSSLAGSRLALPRSITTRSSDSRNRSRA